MKNKSYIFFNAVNPKCNLVGGEPHKQDFYPSEYLNLRVGTVFLYVCCLHIC